MVDRYGRWYEEKDYTNYPKEKMCDYDRMAIWIRKSGYHVKTTMENLIDMIFLHYDIERYDLDCAECDKEFDIEECKHYVMNSGGLVKFDCNI